MKKKRKLLIIISIIILTICIMPNNVFAKEEKPELKWEKEDIKAQYDYGGMKILCAIDNGYVALDSNGEIARFNADGEKENIIVSNVNNVIYAIIDGDYLVFSSSGDNTYNNDYLNKYTLDGTFIYKKEIPNHYNADKIINTNNNYYILDYKYIIKLDKEGNFSNELFFNTICNDFIYNDSRNELIAIDNNNIVYKLDTDLNILAKKEIANDDYNLDHIKEVDNGYFVFGYQNIIKIDYNFEFISEKTFPMYITEISKVEDGYILLGSDSLPSILKIDRNGNIIYEEIYDKYQEGLDVTKIVILENNDYIVQVDIGKNYSEYYGTVILKYGYKDYNITTNIKGEGTIDVNETAKEGEKVTFKINPSNNCELKSIKVVTVSGKVIEVTDNSFIMPDEAVIIEGEFVKTLTSNPETGNIIMLITGISLILILGTIITLYYKKKKAKE